MTQNRSLAALLVIWATFFVHAANGSPQFNSRGELVRPADFRQWVFVTSGLGMTYGPARPQPGEQPYFSNVFVSPEAYEEFVDSGSWPDGTFFVLEIRRSEKSVSINSGGHTQGTRVALEAAVKDRNRFPQTGWAYFNFDTGEVAAPLASTAACYSCHSTHGAVEWTFAQFYPELFEVARELGTVREDYEPMRTLE